MTLLMFQHPMLVDTAFTGLFEGGEGAEFGSGKIAALSSFFPFVMSFFRLQSPMVALPPISVSRLGDYLTIGLHFKASDDHF